MRLYLIGLVFAVTGLFAAPVITWPPADGEAESMLVAAKTAADKYQVEEAVALYTKAIESGRLSTRQLAAAYTGRAEARENYTVAYGLKDEDMVLALADYRKARELMPSVGAYSAEAGALIVLGGYAEAAAAYREALALEQPPHWSLIGFARVERIQGHYDAALKHLDEALRIFREDGGTMPIHYHRGRVLYLQENFAAAVEAFTNGIPKQPDYAFVYQFRACAHARAGAFAKALQDMERAIELLNAAPIEEAWEKTPQAKAHRQDRATDLAVIKAMAAGGAAEGGGAKLCKSTWNDGEQLRERSPLLGLDATKIAGTEARPAWRPANANARTAPAYCSRNKAGTCRP